MPSLPFQAQDVSVARKPVDPNTGCCTPCHRAYIASARVLLRFLPLGVASCAIIPLYWTLPRILGLQAAVPAAVSEGRRFMQSQCCPAPRHRNVCCGA